MKKILVLAAITCIGTLAASKSSAQYDYRAHREIRNDRADIYNDRARLAQIERDKQAAAYYGDRRAYRQDKRAERRLERDMRRDHRDIRHDRREEY